MLKHCDVRKSADLETEEGRKSGIIYSYTCSRIIFHYHSIISTALNLMMIGVMSCIHNLQMFKQKLSRITLIFVCRLFSANKNVHYRLSPLISEELVQSFNGRKVSS